VSLQESFTRPIYYDYEISKNKKRLSYKRTIDIEQTELYSEFYRIE